MSMDEKNLENSMDTDYVDCIEFEDENGNKLYYYEVDVIEYNGKQYALLAPVSEEELNGEDVELESDEVPMTLARIDETAEGQVYIPLEDEEFEEVANVISSLDDEE